MMLIARFDFMLPDFSMINPRNGRSIFMIGWLAYVVRFEAGNDSYRFLIVMDILVFEKGFLFQMREEEEMCYPTPKR